MYKRQELIFSDLEILERRIAKTTKVARNDKAAAKELALLEKIKAHPVSYTHLDVYKRQNIDRSVDLLIVDIGLPDGDGINLYQELQKNGRIPAIFLTAKDDEKEDVYKRQGAE